MADNVGAGESLSTMADCIFQEMYAYASSGIYNVYNILYA